MRTSFFLLLSTFLIAACQQGPVDTPVVEIGVSFPESVGDSALGGPLLLVCIACFSLSSLFTYAYFGGKCFGFLFGACAFFLCHVFSRCSDHIPGTPRSKPLVRK